MRWVLGAYILVISACMWMIIDSAPEEEAVATVVRLTPVTVPDVLATASEVIYPPLGPIATPGNDVFIEAERKMNFIPGETLPPPPKPVPTGLQRKPFAPEGLTGCDEMEFYRDQWELPEYFGGERWQIGWKESNCRNEVDNGFCCYGYWQIHKRYWSTIPECEVYGIESLRGHDPLAKQKNACAAKHVFDISGCNAWTTCPF